MIKLDHNAKKVCTIKTQQVSFRVDRLQHRLKHFNLTWHRNPCKCIKDMIIIFQTKRIVYGTLSEKNKNVHWQSTLLLQAKVIRHNSKLKLETTNLRIGRLKTFEETKDRKKKQEN